MGVYVAAHWLAHRVQLLKNQVHPSWEYNGLQDLTRETQEKITPELLWKHMGEIFQDTSSWPSDEHVRSYHIGVERDPVRCPILVSSIFLRSHVLIVRMQDLDSFILPIPDFEGDIPILAIPISAHPPGGEAIDNPSTGSSADASKTQASKRKATANPTPQKKAKKATGKSSSRIKINELVPKASSSTPPLGPQKGISIHRSRRYAYLEYIFLSPIIW
jgi:hypothetical protein